MTASVDGKSLDSNQPNKPPKFEIALEQLQAAVKSLEGGELSLEQSLQKFEDGIRLARVCQEYLSAAEQRVEVLTKGNIENPS